MHMKRIFTSVIAIAFSLAATAQTQISNGGFENWGNAAPGNADEPTGYYSNKTGSSTAQLGPQTCFKDSVIKHSGNASVRIETKNVPVLSVVVNGNLTTGVVNAPSVNKADGYLGTTKYADSTDIRRMAFNGRPDSLVGWYRYTAANGNELGKVKVILHNDKYYDPETVTAYHPGTSGNRIGAAEFFTPASSVTTWTRFSVPFVYAQTGLPSYIMINATSSADQLTSVAGSILWLDDLSVVYNNSSNVGRVISKENVAVSCANHNLYVDFLNRTAGSSVIRVFDLSGKLVLSGNVSHSQLNTLPMPEVAGGVYVYTLGNENYRLSGKLIIH